MNETADSEALARIIQLDRERLHRIEEKLDWLIHYSRIKDPQLSQEAEDALARVKISTANAQSHATAAQAETDKLSK